MNVQLKILGKNGNYEMTVQYITLHQLLLIIKPIEKNNTKVRNECDLMVHYDISNRKLLCLNFFFL